MILYAKSQPHLALPMGVGAWEAEAIGRRLTGQEFPRPLPWDVMIEIIRQAKGRLESVLITDLIDGVYIGELVVIKSNNQTLQIDCRPSDGIALAVRAGVSIFAKKNLLQEVSVINGEARDQAQSSGSKMGDILKSVIAALLSPKVSPSPTKGAQAASPTEPQEQEKDEISQLRQELKQAVGREDFEQAAHLRDRIRELQEQPNQGEEKK